LYINYGYHAFTALYRVQYCQVSYAFNAVVTATIRLRFDARSTLIRPVIKGH